MARFYNTTGATGERLRKAVEIAGVQERTILHIFRGTDRSFSPKQMQDALNARGFEYMITSIRRAICNLEAQGLIEKGAKDEQVDGGYGHKTYVWRRAA